MSQSARFSVLNPECQLVQTVDGESPLRPSFPRQET